MIQSEVESCVRDVLGYSETPNRMPFDEIFLLTQGNARLVSLGQDRFRSNAVRPNSVRTDLTGKVLGENLYTGLGGGMNFKGLAPPSPAFQWPTVTTHEAIAATTIRTGSRSGSAARSGVSPRPSAARCAVAPPSNPSSATSRRIIASFHRAGL